MNFEVKQELNPSHWVVPGIKKVYKKPDHYMVMKIVSSCFGLTAEQLVEKTRKSDIRIPRQLCQYLLNMKGYSTEKSASSFNQDHATVINSKKRINELLETKFPRHDYYRATHAIRVFIGFFPEVDLSKLPRGWDSSCERV
jgi:hypothetical protein